MLSRVSCFGGKSCGGPREARRGCFGGAPGGSRAAPSRRRAHLLTWIDPVGIVDLRGVQPVDLGPEERIVVVQLSDGPEGLTRRHDVGGGNWPNGAGAGAA